jgi:hypothetical protein
VKTNILSFIIMILLFLPGAWMTYLYFDLRKRPAAPQQPAYTASSAYANFTFHGLDSDNRPVNLGVSLVSIERDTLSAVAKTGICLLFTGGIHGQAGISG